MDTATITNPASPFMPTPHYLDVPNYRASGWDGEYSQPFSTWLGINDEHALYIWHEAQWLDVLFDAHAENTTRLREALDAPVGQSAHERDVEAARRQAEALGATFAQREKLRAIVTERRDAQRALTEAQTTIAQLSERVEQLRNEQITDGGDYRLTEFWERAAQKASDENYCGEYDRMAELLGGPGRVKTYEVTTHVTIELTIQVEARDEDDAVEIVDDYDYNDMERHIADLAYYNISVQEISAREANEA